MDRLLEVHRRTPFERDCGPKPFLLPQMWPPKPDGALCLFKSRRSLHLPGDRGLLGQEMYRRMWEDKLNAVSPRGKPHRVAAAAVAWLVPGDGLTLKARPLPTESK